MSCNSRDFLAELLDVEFHISLRVLLLFIHQKMTVVVLEKLLFGDGGIWLRDQLLPGMRRM